MERESSTNLEARDIDDRMTDFDGFGWCAVRIGEKTLKKPMSRTPAARPMYMKFTKYGIQLADLLI